MGPVSFVARVQRRRRRAAGVVVALVVGLVGGLSIALCAGSGRAGSAVDRYYAPGASVDVSAYGPPLPVEQVRAMPGVIGVSRVNYMGAIATRPDGRQNVFNLYTLDGPPWDPMVRVHAGEVATADDLTSVLVNQTTLDEFGLQLGDEIDVRLFTVDDLFGQIAEGVAQATGGAVRLRVTALIDTPLDLIGDRTTGTSQIGNRTEALVPFGFYLQHMQAGDAADNGYSYDVDLTGPSAVDAFKQAFTQAADAFVANDGGVTGGPQNGLVQFTLPTFASGRSSLAAPARVQATVLLVLALVAGLAGVVVLALLLAADGRLHAAEDPALAAMGMTAPQRSALAARRSLPALAVGVGLAAAVAIGLSGRFPVGTTRVLERHPGISVNVVVVVLGVGAVAALAVLVAFAVGWLSVRPRAGGRPRVSTAARGLARVNAPVGVLVGGHLAFPGRRGRRAVPAWQSVLAGAVAVTALLAVANYAVSIDHLRANRAAHGFVWDVALGNPNFPLSDAAQSRLRAEPALGPLVGARLGGAVIDGQTQAVVALAPTGQAVTVVTGRAPRTPGEIGLGARQMKQLGVGIGDTVRFSLATTDLAQEGVPTPDLELTVVGKVLVSGFGASADLAEVAAVTMDALAAAGASTVPQLLVGNYAEGVDRVGAAASLEERYPLWTMTDVVPAKVYDLWSGRVLPLAGALVVALLGAVLLVYTLATTARMMRRDVAVLRALGMTARGTRDAAIWQGAVIAAVILAIGIPVGLVTGGFVWRAVASQLGVSGHVRGVAWVAAVIPATFLVSVVAAFLPARRARRLHVVDALRVE